MRENDYTVYRLCVYRVYCVSCICVSYAFTITLRPVKLFFSVEVKINVGFTVKQNSRKFYLLYSMLKRTFEYGPDMSTFRDFKVWRRDRDFKK